MQPFDIYVVSLVNSPRRAIFSENAKTELRWRFFDAHDKLHPDLSYDAARSQIFHGRTLRPGELGCFSSHYAIWRAAAADGRDVVVFEDDVYVDWPFFERLVREEGLLSSLEYLRFFSKRCPTNIELEGFMDRKLVEYLGHPFGTQAYYMSSQMAKKLVGEINEVLHPIDDEMDRAWVHAMPNLGVLPPAVLELSHGSQIGQRLPVRQGGWVRLLNLVIRVREKARKELYFIGRRLRARAA